MSPQARTHEDPTLHSIKSTLLDAIQVVLERELKAARKAHHIHPNLRFKELGRIRNDDVDGLGIRRLTQIAERLGIVVEINVKLPRR